MVYGECSGCRQKADDGDAAFGTIDSWLVYKLTKGKSYKTIIQMPVVPSF